MNDVSSLSIHEVLNLLQHGTISSEELTKNLLNRVHTLNSGLSAYIHVNELAVDQARAVDNQRRSGAAVGVLAGVPIAVKDLIDTKDQPTTYGGQHYHNFTPKESASVVKRLREAGAIIIGKTNLHEYAYGVTNENPHFGASRNPWNIKKITGGSSGGNSSALMSGMAYGAVGTDTGGSIRIPAALCGHVGLKPTYGRVSRHGVFPLAMSLDHVGPMTRTVADAALMLDVMAGYDSLDDTSARIPFGTFTEQRSQIPLKIGLPKNFFFKQCQEEISEAVYKLIQSQPSGSIEVIEVDIPMVDELPQMQNIIISSEARFIHEARVKSEPELYGSDVRERLVFAEGIRGFDYVTALAYREEFIQTINRLFSDIDVIVTPTTPITATDIGASSVKIGTEEAPLRPQLTRYTNPWNFGGFPAITIPCALSLEGLPIGVQLVAARFGEAKLLSIAQQFERQISFETAIPNYRG